jgi:hypothetical protein
VHPLAARRDVGRLCPATADQHVERLLPRLGQDAKGTRQGSGGVPAQQVAADADLASDRGGQRGQVAIVQVLPARLGSQRLQPRDAEVHWA